MPLGSVFAGLGGSWLWVIIIFFILIGFGRFGFGSGYGYPGYGYPGYAYGGCGCPYPGYSPWSSNIIFIFLIVLLIILLGKIC